MFILVILFCIVHYCAQSHTRGDFLTLAKKKAGPGKEVKKARTREMTAVEEGNLVQAQNCKKNVRKEQVDKVLELSAIPMINYSVSIKVFSKDSCLQWKQYGKVLR
jgi:hypothetical protein